MSNSLILLNKKQIEQKLDRIAYQILEDVADEPDFILAGIAERGYMVALRLKLILEQLSTQKITLLKVIIKSGEEGRSPKVLAPPSKAKDSTSKGKSSEESDDFDLALCADKTVIVVDDVLNTGKTLARGLSIFFSLPVKKLRTAILVDRSHKLFPVKSDFTGLEISTVAHEHVSLILEEAGKEDCVILV